MAIRPNTGARQQLTAPELVKLRHELADLPIQELETYYKASHGACRFTGRPPSPRLIQELVQAWRELVRRNR